MEAGSQPANGYRGWELTSQQTNQPATQKQQQKEHYSCQWTGPTSQASKQPTNQPTNQPNQPTKQLTNNQNITIQTNERLTNRPTAIDTWMHALRSPPRRPTVLPNDVFVYVDLNMSNYSSIEQNLKTHNIRDT